MSGNAVPPTFERTVLVLSTNTGTFKGLRHYFAETGVPLRTLGTLNIFATVRESVGAVVLFPDDFVQADVAAYLQAVRIHRPGLRVVIITRSPATLEPMVSAGGEPMNALVLPRPAFGWAILDAIRYTLGGNGAHRRT